MFESLHNVNDVIKFVAAYDDKGASTKEIDTKLEFEILGKYLNGANAWTTDGNGNEYAMNYADLSSQDKNVLFNLMDSLKSKFGDWKNYFTSDTEIDNEVIHLYLQRYKEFMVRLNQFTDDTQREEYFNDIKQELIQVTKKITNYCSKYKLPVSLDMSTISDLHEIFYNISYEEKVKNFLNGIDDNFKITDENAKEYSELANYLFHNEEALYSISKEDFNKAVDIMRIAFAEYFYNYNRDIDEERIVNLDIEDGVNQISAYLESKQQNSEVNPELRDAIRDFLTGFEAEFTNLNIENAPQYAGMFQFMIENHDKLNFTEEEKIQFEKLKNAYAGFLHKWLDEINEDNVLEFSITRCTTLAVDYFNRLEDMKTNSGIVQNVIHNPYDNKILQNSIQQYINDNKIPPLQDIPEGVDIGNGKFDKVSTQKAPNCWLHSGIDTLLSCDDGKKLLESNYYRDKKTGVIAVHIQEAENYGLHGGIFYVTPQEIIDAQETAASGEGDITAYIIAVQKYFDEVNSNPELKDRIGEDRIFSAQDEGNAGFRFYELITGAECTTILPQDKDEIKNIKGLGRARGESVDTDALYNIVKNHKGAITIALRGEEHSVSIIGVRDGKFLVQESNNDTEYLKQITPENFEILFEEAEPVNNRPTFALSPEVLKKYDLGMIDYLTWE